MKAIPKKHRHKVESIFQCEDGSWWIYLKTNWYNPELECSMLHEETKKEVINGLDEVIKK